MSGRSGGDIWKMVWQNFKQSFRRGHLSDVYVGKDQYGNKYFERASDSAVDARAQRRVVPPNPNDQTVVPEMPVEWMAWLRGRRVGPPTEEEIARNVAALKDVLKKADELEQEENKALDQPRTKDTVKRAPASKYPIYADYDAEADDKRRDDDADPRFHR